MENYGRLFKVSYKGPTNNSGARIIIKDERHNKRRILDFNYEYGSSAAEQAMPFFNKKGIKIKAYGEDEKFYYFLTDDFSTQI